MAVPPAPRFAHPGSNSSAPSTPRGWEQYHTGPPPPPLPVAAPTASPSRTPPAPSTDSLSNPFPDEPPEPAPPPLPVDSPKDMSQDQLTAPLPDVPALESAREKALALGEPSRILRWVRDVVRFLERTPESVRYATPQIDVLIDHAAGWVTRLCETPGTPPELQGEALLVRGDLRSSGALFPRQFRKSLRGAFSDYDRARHYCPTAWARIGRDYEALNSIPQARNAYECGVSQGEVGCLYRIAMAYLMGQLGLRLDYREAIRLLRQAANHVSVDTPQPAYIYGMVLVQEFSSLPIPVELLLESAAQSGSGRSLDAEAGHYIAKAAYFHCPQAQLKMGWGYENARLDLPFDPLLSVQWYSLASQAGQAEADMALSKWFLCGAEKCFDVNEALAYQFAEKAAANHLPSAEFAMGYYSEVGVGCNRDLETSKQWYNKAAKQGNQDAVDRLGALVGPQASAQEFSRQAHQKNIDATIQPSRNLAAQRTIARRKKQGSSSAARVAAAQAQVAAHPLTQANLEAQQDVSRPASPAPPLPASPRPYQASGGSSGSQTPPPSGQVQQEPLRRKQTLSMAKAAAGGGRYGRGAGRAGRAAGRAASGSTPTPETPSDAPPQAPRPSSGVKYNTFSEMGFQPKKQDDRDCVIM